MSIGPVPSYATFIGSVIKPECFTEIVGIQTVAEALLAQNTDYFASAFGDRATYPILTWDNGCVKHVVALTARALMAYRGYKRDPIADNEYIALAEKADKYRDGVKNKDEHPSFTDSTKGFRPDTPLVTGAYTSDAWTKRGHCGCHR